MLQLIILVPIFIVSIVIHELCHALVADSLGDPTPREQGRLTLSPMAHVDPFGTLMILIAGFGWARPVQVKPHLFIWPRLGSFLVSAAGPLSNAALAAIALLVMKFFPELPPGSLLWLRAAVALNVTLAVLNLLPLPPLDGGNLLESVLPRRWLPSYEHLVPYGTVALVLLVLLPGHPLGFLFGWAIDNAYALFGVPRFMP